MCPCKSLRLIAAPQHRFRGFDGPGCQSVHAALLRPVQGAAEVHRQCFAGAWSERCGAGCVPRLAAPRGWVPDLRLWRYRQLRPHASLLHKAPLREVPASQSRSSFGVVHRFAPCGFTQQALCKVAYAGPGLSAVGATRSVPALRAGNCRPCVVLALWVQSVASQVFLVSGLRPCILCLPRPPSGPRHASRALALRGLPVRPQGAPSYRAVHPKRLDILNCRLLWLSTEWNTGRRPL